MRIFVIVLASLAFLGMMFAILGPFDQCGPILDQPSVVILERLAGDLERMRTEAAALQRTLKLTAGATALAARERTISTIVAGAA